MSETTGSGPRAGYGTSVANLAADRERILALWREGLGQNGMPGAKFDWYYVRNVEGAPTVLFLHASGETVGAASIGRRRMRRGAETLEAGALADFIVASSHRSFFPALHLQQAMRRQALTRYGVVYGMPNPQSEAIVKRAGYRRVGDIVRRARVLRSGAYISRHVPSWLAGAAGAILDVARHAVTAVRARATGAFRAAWSDSAPSGAGQLWERASAQGLLIGARDERFLAWRFGDCPLYRCRFLHLAREGSGELAGYAVCLERDDTTHVVDFLADGSVTGALDRLWLEVALEAWRRGSRSASVEFLGPATVARSIESAGWVARERRALWAAFEGMEPPADAGGWYMTAADEDA